MKIIVNGKQQCFVETANVFHDIFLKCGFESVEIIYVSEFREKIDCDNKISFCITGKYNNIDIVNTSKKIVYFVEQPDQFKRHKSLLKQFDHVIFMFKESFDEWKGDNKHFLPFGYHKLLEAKNDVDECLNDFYFFGSVSKKRNAILCDKVHFKTNCFGDERDKLIESAKINLIIGARKNYTLPSMHLSLILCKKKFVAINNIKHTYPFLNYFHVVPYKHLEELNGWIEDDEKRHEHCEKVFKHFKKYYNLEKWTINILKKINI